MIQALAAHAHMPLAPWLSLLGLLTPAPPKSGEFAMSSTAGAKPPLRAVRSHDREATVEDGHWRGRRASPSDYSGDHWRDLDGDVARLSDRRIGPHP